MSNIRRATFNNDFTSQSQCTVYCILGNMLWGYAYYRRSHVCLHFSSAFLLDAVHHSSGAFITLLPRARITMQSNASHYALRVWAQHNPLAMNSFNIDRLCYRPTLWNMHSIQTLMIYVRRMVEIIFLTLLISEFHNFTQIFVLYGVTFAKNVFNTLSCTMRLLKPYTKTVGTNPCEMRFSLRVVNKLPTSALGQPLVMLYDWTVN